MRGSPRRWAASPCPRLRTRRRGIGRLSRSLDVQWQRGRRARREAHRDVRVRPRGRQIPKRRMQVPLQWGNCCTMRCGPYSPRSKQISALILAETARNIPWAPPGFYLQPSPCVIVSSQQCTSTASRQA